MARATQTMRIIDVFRSADARRMVRTSADTWTFRPTETENVR